MAALIWAMAKAFGPIRFWSDATNINSKNWPRAVASSAGRPICRAHWIISEDTVYFDAQLTQLRAPAVQRAIQAGKHVYCEKPTGVSTEEAYALYEMARDAGVKHGVVQDKLWLPGLQRLRVLIDSGFFGKILSVRGEFGYWVFTGHDQITPQRPSWNYRSEDGGGIIVDMLCHWRYVLDHLFGEVQSVSCLGRDAHRRAH